MKVRLMREPEFAVLVTGCDDIEQAKIATLAEYEDELVSEFYDPTPAEEWFKLRPGRVELGRIFNCRDHDPFGMDCDWYWMPTSKPGRGVTRAVVFDSLGATR